MSRHCLTLCTLMAVAVLGGVTFAAGTTNSGRSDQGESIQIGFKLKAPSSGLPGGRVGGGVRGGWSLAAPKSGGPGGRVGGGVRGGWSLAAPKSGGPGGRVGGGVRGGWSLAAPKEGGPGGRVGGGVRGDWSLAAPKEGGPGGRVGGGVRGDWSLAAPKDGGPSGRVGGGVRGDWGLASPNDGAPSGRVGSGVRGDWALNAPKDGEPEGTSGSGVRGIQREQLGMPILSVLTPSEIGLALNDQPTLFWYQSAPVNVPVVFFLIDAENDEKPVLDLVFDDDKAFGFRSVDLKKHNVKLVPGRDYEWSVQIVVNSYSPSNNIFSSGWIRCMDQTSEVIDKLPGDPGPKRLMALANESLWYDTLTELEAAIVKHPDDNDYRDARIELLAAVGLPDASNYDKSQLKKADAESPEKPDTKAPPKK